MTGEIRLFSAMSGIEPDIIAEAEGYRPQRSRTRLKWAALAASLALAVGIGALALNHIDGGSRPGISNAAGPTEYEGPVLPLTALGDLEGVTARRQAQLDFSGFGDPDTPYSERFVVPVRDTYTLENSSDSDKTLTLLYPFTGSFFELPEASVTVDGAEAETQLLSGPYSGTFLGYTDDFPHLSFYNLRDFDAYAGALSDGRYLEEALGGAPELTEKVTVYEITNPRSEQKGEAPSIAITFDIDYSSVSVLSSGINGGKYYRDEGRMRLGFFIPNPAAADYGRTRFIIVRGGQIGPLTIQGYENLGWNDGEEIEASADIRSYETTLGEILDDIVALSAVSWEKDERYRAVLSHMDLYLQELKRSFKTYGGGAFETAERYKNGEDRLTEILNEILGADRVFYLRLEVTVPAGGSVDVTAELKKPATQYGYGESRSDLSSYSVAGTLGSELDFTSNTVELVNTEAVEFIDPTNPGAIIDVSPTPVDTGEEFSVTVKRK